ncbi:hypothetical protein V5O48_018942, partial [Marasmius crinis-equi]
MSNSSLPSSTGEKATVVGSKKHTSDKNSAVHVKKATVVVPEEKGKEGKKENDLAPVSLAQLFRYSTKFELIMDYIGLIASAAGGAAQPLMTLLFGELVKAFVDFQAVVLVMNDSTQPDKQEEARAAFSQTAAKFRHDAANLAIWLAVIACAMFVATYLYLYIWVYTGEVNAKRIRERYLQAILRQDIAFFDKVGAGEVTTRIQTDTHLVQQGISEKVALVVNFLASFVVGFILAYARNWRLALAMSSMLPCIAIAGGIMNKFLSKYMQESLKHVADGGNLAEEVISTIRTTQAFGSQKILGSMYNIHVERARIVDVKAAVVHGIALAFFFFVIYSSYALAFSFGMTLVLSGHADIGQVINVFMAILIGSFSLAMLAPEMQAITHARGAAAKLYATIDSVPDIDSSNPGGDKPSVEGEISFEHVKFAYPSRPGVIVVKDLSLTFRAGKTVALVGASGSGKSTVISMIERFYDPLEGTVKLDGRDLKTLNLKWLRSQIGLVSQEPTLFATTIRDNVAHGLINTRHEHASPEEKFRLVKEASIKSNADGFISKLPNGYDTMVGERGFLLSGGQK